MNSFIFCSGITPWKAFTIFLSFFSLTNFIKNDNVLFSKKVNLGLDLQGGSYLLLEVDSTPILSRNLQEKLLDIRKNEINSILSNYKNLLFEIFLTSSKKNTGITEIQKSIFNLTKWKKIILTHGFLTWIIHFILQKLEFLTK